MPGLPRCGRRRAGSACRDWTRTPSTGSNLPPGDDPHGPATHPVAVVVRWRRPEWADARVGRSAGTRALPGAAPPAPGHPALTWRAPRCAVARPATPLSAMSGDDEAQDVFAVAEHVRLH